MKNHRTLMLSLCCLIGLLSCMAAKPTFALDKIYSPTINKGEAEFEYGGNDTYDSNHNKNNNQDHEFEIEYGLTDHFGLELTTGLQKESGESLENDAFGLGGRVEFFEQGEYQIDSGLLLTYNRSFHPNQSPDEIEAKVLLETQTGEFLHRANIGFVQDVMQHAHNGPDRFFLWNSRYLYRRELSPGLELQSDFGSPNRTHSIDQGQHYLGPGLYGSLIPHVRYEAVYFFGVSEAAASRAARVLLEYETTF